MSVGEHRQCYVTFEMRKKTYRFCNLRKWKDFNKKQLTLLKMSVTSLLCGPRADLWPFYGFLCKRFSLCKPLPLRNNADVHRCSYFELGLPVRTPSHPQRFSLQIERRGVTWRYPSSKIFRSQQSFLTEKAICIVEQRKKSLSRQYRFVLECKHAQ